MLALNSYVKESGTHLDILVRRPIEYEMTLPRDFRKKTSEPDRLLDDFLKATPLFPLFDNHVRRTTQERPL